MFEAYISNSTYLLDDTIKHQYSLVDYSFKYIILLLIMYATFLARRLKCVNSRKMQTNNEFILFFSLFVDTVQNKAFPIDSFIIYKTSELNSTPLRLFFYPCYLINKVGNQHKA